MIRLETITAILPRSVNHMVLQENRMDSLEKLLELDDMHNELLEQLAQLDAKISETLSDWVSGTTTQPLPVTEKNRFSEHEITDSSGLRC